MWNIKHTISEDRSVKLRTDRWTLTDWTWHSLDKRWSGIMSTWWLTGQPGSSISICTFVEIDCVEPPFQRVSICQPLCNTDKWRSSVSMTRNLHTMFLRWDRVRIKLWRGIGRSVWSYSVSIIIISLRKVKTGLYIQRCKSVLRDNPSCFRIALS